MRRTVGIALLGAVAPAAALGLWAGWARDASGAAPAAAARPARSGPIAISGDDRFVWVVNPENNSVSILEVGGDVNQKVREVRVGAEPRSVAITPNNLKVYVTNMVGGTVSVINGATGVVTKAILVGAEPFGCAVTPDGSRLYVANFGSDSVSVINTATDAVVKTIPIPSGNSKPRGIAITADGSKVYVTSFLARLVAGGIEGADDGKEGRVTVIETATNTVVGTVALEPLDDTGFKAQGDALARIPPGMTFDFTTGAFPNLLQGIAIKGTRAYVPNTASSPNGPVRFDVNVQSFLSVFDTAADADSGQTINMNSGVENEPPGVRLFNTNPIAVDFKQSEGVGYVALAATNRLLKVELAADGTPTINPPPTPMDPSGIVRIEVGLNPQGLVINSTDTRAYVQNRISRDVSVVDIRTGSATEDHQIARIPSAALPSPGSLAARVHRGHELFNTAIGPAGTVANALPPAGRMSSFGWGACYSCHPDGLHDGVTWIFPDGPRQSISMESTAEHPQAALLNVNVNANGAPLLPVFRQRLLNWSAARDEIQDFERNIRAVSGGEGLIPGVPIADVPDLIPVANTGRNDDLDAIAAYISFGVRAPISPLRPTNVGGGQADPDLFAGRALFAAANCQSCHGGPNWTRSRVFYVPPPDPSLVVRAQIISALAQVGTFDPNAFNEVRQNAAPPLGADGFNIPSLITAVAGAPYLHNAQAQTLDEVLLNVTHRSAGTGGVDTLTNAADRAKVVKFMKSIDARTPPFP